METPQTSEPSQQCVITLALVAEEGGDDSALLTTLGHETLVALQREGYRTHPAPYSEEKGVGAFLVELVTTAWQIATTLWDHHAAIAEGIADASGLLAICAGLSSVLK